MQKLRVSRKKLFNRKEKAMEIVGVVCSLIGALIALGGKNK